MAITGQSPLFAPPSVTEKRFVRRLRDGKSPAADEAVTIYRRMVSNGFDPLIALGQFQAESNLGTKGHAKDTMNWGNILFYPWTAELGAVDHAPGNGFHYSKFPSWTQGARAYIRLTSLAYATRAAARLLIPSRSRSSCSRTSRHAACRRRWRPLP